MPPAPNVLFLMTDHTHAPAIAPESPCLKPHLDALAAEGRRFARCYTPNAICSPSRASLMTGCYPSTHGVWDCTHTQNKNWIQLLTPPEETFSARLAAAGYQTGYFGKWHVERSGQLNRFGWREFDIGCGGARLRADPLTRRVALATPGYPDALLAGVDTATVNPRHPAFDRGIDFIRRAAAEPNRPFCCFVSAVEPHDAYVPPRAFLDRYAIDRLPLPPSLRDDLADKPEAIRRIRSVWNGLSDDDWRFARAAYWAVISFLDAEVGRILTALRETGQYDNTLIVFTSDHGDLLGAHGIPTKGIGTPYEEVYNIPCIIRAPGRPAGVEDRETRISLVDLAPTVVDLCGTEPLPAAQGRSLRPVLESAHFPADWRDAYAEFYGQRFVYTQRIVWHGDWKYVFNPAGIDELYDLARDPFERRNLAGDPRHRDTLLDLCRRMWRKMKAIGDDALYNTAYATLRTAPVGPLDAGP